MGVLIHRRWLRHAVLGLMFLLAGAANCLCASYDADPNDDIPAVTVEFQYLVSQHAAGHVKNAFSRHRSMVYRRANLFSQAYAWRTTSVAPKNSSNVLFDSSQLSVSLRC